MFECKISVEIWNIMNPYSINPNIIIKGWCNGINYKSPCFNNQVDGRVIPYKI